MLLMSFIVTFAAGSLFGLFLAAFAIERDLKGDRKMIKKWHEKYID